MEMTWLMRFRILGVIAVGVLLVGWLGEPLVRPVDPEGAITLYGGAIRVTDAAACLALALAAGAAAFFIAWPYGWYIAPLAAPAGLCFWTLRSGTMFNLMLYRPTVAERQEVYAALSWEGLFWLLVVAAGFAGAAAARTLVRQTPPPIPGQQEGRRNKGSIVNGIGALLVSVVIGQVGIGLLAQDVRLFDAQIGSVVGQPGAGQIAFASFASFAIAAFIAKRFFNTHFGVPVVASSVVVYVGIVLFASKPDILQYMVDTYAPAFFPRSACAVLPLQMVAWSVPGAMAGYWLAIQMEYHRQQK